jgi:hypothetical protein
MLMVILMITGDFLAMSLTTDNVRPSSMPNAWRIGKLTIAEIANLLNLSVYTVETHRAKLMQKLNLRSVPEVILYAVRKGIIS